jgi:branched-chain amino acid transport system substrate-binding protein
MMAEEVVKRRGITKVAILADSTNYGQLGKDDLVAALEKLGVKPVAIEKFNVRDPDMTPQLLPGFAGGCLVMGWSGRVPALPARYVGRGGAFEGARP